MAGTKNTPSREPKGRAGHWTVFAPTDPPQRRRRSDEGRSRLESAPEASGESRAYSRRWYTLGVLCLSLLVIVVDTTIVNVALPTLGAGGGPRLKAWLREYYTIWK
jgi:hypothetical protein